MARQAAAQAQAQAEAEEIARQQEQLAALSLRSGSGAYAQPAGYYDVAGEVYGPDYGEPESLEEVSGGPYMSSGYIPEGYAPVGGECDDGVDDRYY
jgi:hypothetical protein